MRIPLVQIRVNLIAPRLDMVSKYWMAAGTPLGAKRADCHFELARNLFAAANERICRRRFHRFAAFAGMTMCRG
jgi:hypothetical protein